MLHQIIEKQLKVTASRVSLVPNLLSWQNCELFQSILQSFWKTALQNIYNWLLPTKSQIVMLSRNAHKILIETVNRLLTYPDFSISLIMITSLLVILLVTCSSIFFFVAFLCHIFFLVIASNKELCSVSTKNSIISSLDFFFCLAKFEHMNSVNLIEKVFYNSFSWLIIDFIYINVMCSLRDLYMTWFDRL